MKDKTNKFNYINTLEHKRHKQLSNKKSNIQSKADERIRKLPAAVTSPDQYSNHCHHK